MITPPPPDQCALVKALDAQLREARNCVSSAAATLWPGWELRSTPVVVIDAAGRRWRFGGALPAQKRLVGCKTPEGVILRIGQRAVRRRPFRAVANREGSSIYLEITEPAGAPFPFDHWVAVFAHELFHCHQLANLRWAAAFRLASPKNRSIKRLHSLYIHSEWLRTDIHEQLRLIAEILASDELPNGPLARLLQLRRRHQERLRAYSSPLADAERAAEAVEGAARFVELGLIERTHPSAVDQPPAVRRPRGLSVSDNRYYYATGHGLLRIFERAQLPWRDRIAAGRPDELLAELVTRDSGGWSPSTTTPVSPSPR